MEPGKNTGLHTGLHHLGAMYHWLFTLEKIFAPSPSNFSSLLTYYCLHVFKSTTVQIMFIDYINMFPSIHHAVSLQRSVPSDLLPFVRTIDTTRNWLHLKTFWNLYSSNICAAICSHCASIKMLPTAMQCSFNANALHNCNSSCENRAVIYQKLHSCLTVD